MPPLPTPLDAATNNVWGTALNNWLLTGHNTDGSHAPATPLQGYYNVRAAPYNASGGGTADDLAAIQAAIDAANAAGGGVVYFPPGTYAITNNLLLKSNVYLRGAGRNVSTIRNMTAASGVSIVWVQNTVTNFGIEDLTLQARTDVDFMQILYIDGASVGWLKNLTLTGGNHFAIQVANNAQRIQGSGLYLTGQVKNPNFASGGTGLWIYRGSSGCTFTGLVIEECDGAGLILDAGTSDGLGIVTRNNVISGVILRNVCKLSANNALEIEGACDNIIEGLVIDGAGTATHDAVGIILNRDQAGISSDRNVISNFVLRNLSGHPINIIGGSRNLFVNGEITMFNTNNTSADRAITIQETTSFSGSDASDNHFKNLAIDNTGGGTYGNGVVFSAPTRNLYRNRFEGCSFGNYSGLIVLRSDTEGRVPLNGANQNFIDGVMGHAFGDNAHYGMARLYIGDNAPASSLGVDGDFYFQDYPRIAASATNSPWAYRKDAGAWVQLTPTRNTGTTTLLSGNTTVTVTHNLGAAPTRVLISPTADTLGQRFWVSAKGATTFTITANTGPASNVTFDWLAQIGEG